MSKLNLSPEDLSFMIGLVYDSAFEVLQWKSLIERIENMFPGILAVVNGHDGGKIIKLYTTSSQRKFLKTISYNDMIVGNDTVASAMLRSANGYVARSRKYDQDYPNFPSGAWFKTPFFTKILQPNGFTHVMTLKLDSIGKRGAMLAFLIPTDPEADERIHDPLFELLKLLSPHAVRAFQLARALALAKQATEVFSGFLDGIILPMLVTDTEGKFMFGNAAGRRVLERGTPLMLTQAGRLSLQNQNDSTALYRKISETDRNQTPSGLKVETDEAPLLLSVTPFRASMKEASAIDRDLLSEERLFAVFIGQSAVDAISTSLLEDVFDLTPREAEVCKNLMLGSNASDIADESGRSLKTVRNQIQIIYEKVGVSSNIALIDTLSVFRTVGNMFMDEGTTARAIPLAR